MDSSPPGSSVCEIFQARTVEWVAIVTKPDIGSTSEYVKEVIALREERIEVGGHRTGWR